MAIGPMIGHEDEVNGLFYFYNSAQGSINMNTVKKMKAISKLLGGCSSLVGVTAEQLLIKVGLQSKMETIEEQLKNKET